MLKRVLWFCVNWLRSILAGAIISFNLFSLGFGMVYLLESTTFSMGGWMPLQSSLEFNMELEATDQFSYQDGRIHLPDGERLQIEMDPPGPWSGTITPADVVGASAYWEGGGELHPQFDLHSGIPALLLPFLVLTGLNSVLVHTLKTPYWRNKQVD